MEDPPATKRKLEALRDQRDELKKTVESQDRLIQSLGLDDEDKVQQVKRIMTMAKKEGGLELMERRLMLFKRRQKSDYEAVVLGSSMSLLPNDLISVTWDGGMHSLAIVSGDPDPSHPLDLHIKLCLRSDAKKQISTVIKADPSTIQRVHQSKLGDTVRRVFGEDNLKKLHALSGEGTLGEFRTRLWEDMFLVIRSRFPESIGQLMCVGKALGIKNAE